MNVIKKTYQVVSFIIYYVFKLVQANIVIAYDILTPKMRTNPGFTWIKLEIKSDLGILLFSNLLSMTPGTISVDVTEKKDKILVHYLYNDQNNSVLDEIDKIQKKIVLLTG